MNIDASLAKAVTKFANKKMKSFYNDNSFPDYRERLEKDIAKTALDGQSSIEYSSSNDLKFYKFILNIYYELKKEGFKIKRNYENAPCGAVIGIITISWR